MKLVKLFPFIPKQNIYAVTGYIRQQEQELHLFSWVPTQIANIIAWNAYFYEIFPNIKRGYYDASNQNEEYALLGMIGNLLKLRSRWDEETIEIFDGKFVEYTFSCLIINHNALNVRRITNVIRLLQLNNYRECILTKFRPQKTLWKLLIKFNDNQHIKRDTLYLFTTLVNEDRYTRIFLSRQSIFEYLSKQINLFSDQPIIDDISVQIWCYLVLLLKKLCRYYIRPHTGPYTYAHIDSISSFISDSIFKLNKLYHQIQRNEIKCNLIWVDHICEYMSSIISRITKKTEESARNQLINTMNNNGTLKIYITFFTKYALIRGNLLDFISNVFQSENPSHIKLILDTKIMTHFIEYMTHPNKYAISKWQRHRIMLTWCHLFRSEFNPNQGIILLNENLIQTIFKELQCESSANIKAALLCVNSIFDNVSLSPFKIIKHNQGEIIDTLKVLLIKMKSNNTNINTSHYMNVIDLTTNIIEIKNNSSKKTKLFISTKMKENKINDLLNELQTQKTHFGVWFLNLIADCDSQTQ